MGWVIQQHRLLYAQEYGWDARLEVFVAPLLGCVRLTEEKPHQSFGPKLVGQMWELVL